MDKPIADIWFGVEPCEGRITHIRETHIDQWAAGDIWLIHGAERDLVFDTGTGLNSPAPIMAMLSDNPKIAVASCYYYDHAGGLYAFEEQACHRMEANSMIAPPGDEESLLDEEFYALPYEGFKAGDYIQKPANPTLLLEDEEIIDLGNRKLTVLHIPGRTPGSLALWEEETGFLFGGETAFVDPFNHDFPPENREQYEESLRRLGRLPITKIFGGHYGSFGPEQLERLIENEIGRYQ
ncbi:MAG: MBL fold metallo-hydrolase [Anderseniella sp.]|jgi:glyoxylase-like metal-dependent hydrolase (beta-lactamase superfamily II)|nr:MBL fold metallo-hydrolase [Anderseniella sp.]